MKKVLFHIKKNTYSCNGFSLIEILVSFAIFLLFVNVIFNITTNSSKQFKHSINVEKAVIFAEEAVEAVRNIRDEDFDNLSNGIYGLTIVSNEWEFYGLSNTDDIFTRVIEITDIGIDKKQIDVIVTWDDQISSDNSFILSSILTNWRKYIPPEIVGYFETKKI